MNGNYKFCFATEGYGVHVVAFRRCCVARMLALIVSVTGCWQAGSESQAATLIWDTVSGDGSTITGGAGTWTGGLGNWNTGSGDTTWTSATPDSATFGGTAGTVTLGGL